MNKFYDLYMQGRVKIEDLDDFLEEWNCGSSNEAINEYLGLTEEQYYKWVDAPRKLESELDLIKNHQHNQLPTYIGNRANKKGKKDE